METSSAATANADVGDDLHGRSDSDWIIRFEVTPDNRRAVQSLTALCNGSFGTWGLLASTDQPAHRGTMANGIYDSGPLPSLLSGPRWTTLDIPEYGSDVLHESAQLDLHRGTLRVEVNTGERGTVSALFFASCVQPGLHGLCVEGPRSLLPDEASLAEPVPQPGVTAEWLEFESGADSDGHLDGLSVESERGRITAVANQTVADHEGRRSIYRLVIFGSSTDGANPAETCHDQLSRATSTGFSALLAEHSACWGKRWALVGVDIGDSPALQRAFRFAQYHLLSSAINRPSTGSDSKIECEASIGARGLTGHAYRGHVFWDTDVYVAPALSAMAPTSSLAALTYRYRRLAAAKLRALSDGFDGARYPWESAASGFDVTPTEARDLQGNIVPINTGSMEEHIVADVAWAVNNYLLWTGDRKFERGPGVEILTETARYWRSRLEGGDDGALHLSGVIGPDEYHEAVQDNAFTNVMAGWNLRQAAESCERLGLGNSSEQRAWRNTAEQISDCYVPALGIHEQFAGFQNLEPVMATSIGKPPLPADALLGRDRIQQVQVIKQADVLMLHHMVPELMPPGSLERDLAFYLPRTAHGSSLSPAITASVLARAGRLFEAQEWFEMAARFDLDDLSGTTAGGLHLATMGGLWQAFSQGFLGVRPLREGLAVDPNTPHEWGRVTHRFFFRSVPIQLNVSSDELLITAEAPIDLILSGQQLKGVQRLRAARVGNSWEVR